MTLQQSLKYLAFTLLFVYGCGGNEPPPSKVGNTLRVRLEAAAPFLNPVRNSTAYGRYISTHIFQTLTALDPKTIELQPLMIKSIPKLVKVTDGPYKDNYSCTFELLDEAQWDNGTPVTAADVEFSLKLIAHPLLDTKIWRGYIETLIGFEPDPANAKKFTFYFKEYYIMALESASQFPMYPAQLYDPGNLLAKIPFNDLLDPKKSKTLSESNQDFINFATEFNKPEYGTDKNKISGSGPYAVAFFDPAQGAILARKKNWWGDKAVKTNPFLVAYPDTIHYILAQAEDAAINMIRSEDVDIATSIAPVKFLEMQKDPALTKIYDFKTHWMPAYNRLLINHRDPILADKRVRQALAYSVNYDEILKDIQNGMAERTVGPVHPSNPNYAKDVPLYNFSTEKARALLAEAGWSDSDNDGVMDKKVNGKKTDLTFKMITTSGTAVSDQIAASLQNSLAKSGIKAEVVPTDFTSINKETMAGKYQLAISTVGLHPGTIDFYQVYHSDNILPGDNRSGLANARLDSLIETIRVTESVEVRKPMYIQAQEIMHEEVPEVFIYVPMVRMISNKRFEFSPTALRPGYQENTFQLKK